MTWASFEAALTGADGAPAALDALTVLCMPEVRETFARVRAEEAAPLLEEATASEPAQRGPKLAAALEILDREIEVYLPLTTAQARREAHDAEQRHVLAKEVHRQEFSVSSHVLVQVFQMATNGTKQPRSRLRFGRRS